VPLGPDGDEWLTLAEAAAELRVHASTVRLWVNTGQIRAVRSGRRKWLVSRSEITRMLRPASASTDRVSPAAPDPYSPPTLRPGERHVPARISLVAVNLDHQLAHDRLRSADSAWERALHASAFAPPDPGLPDRLRAIADASAEEAVAFAQAEEAGMSWVPLGSASGMTLSYELRSGGNRRASPDPWRSFDNAVNALGIAMEGTEPHAVAYAFSKLADAAHALADESRIHRSAALPESANVLIPPWRLRLPISSNLGPESDRPPASRCLFLQPPSLTTRTYPFCSHVGGG